MPTQKKFLDQAGLIQLLQEIESLDETNIKDVYWSTDNADSYPTAVFKVGDDNGSPHTIKKITFKGDVTTPVPSGTVARTMTITIGGVDKTITYYDSTTASSLADNPSVTLSAANGSGGQTITVTAGGKSGTSAALASASTSAYGVVKLATVSAQATGDADATNDSLVPTLGDVKKLIKNVNQAQFVITDYTSASQLPTVTISNRDQYLGKIYLILDQEYGDTNNNIYNEYVVVEYENSNQVIDYRWELLGTTDAGVDVVTIPATGSNSVASLFATYVTNA